MQTTISTALMAIFLLSGAPQPTVDFAQTETVSEIRIEEKASIASYSVSLTGYNAVPEQTDSDPFTTASGAYSNPDMIVARSVDLKEELPFGTVIQFVFDENASKGNCGLSMVEHLVGYRVVADSMHPRKVQQLDILFDKNDTVQVGKKDLNPAVVLGVCKNIKMQVVGKIEIKNMPTTQTELIAMVNAASLAVGK